MKLLKLALIKYYVLNLTSHSARSLGFLMYMHMSGVDKCHVFHLSSYGAGLLGSLMYMRMLGNSVDSIRTDGPKALIKYAFHDSIFS